MESCEIGADSSNKRTCEVDSAKWETPRSQHTDHMVQRQTNGLGYHCPRLLCRITHWRHCHKGGCSGQPTIALHRISSLQLLFLWHIKHWVQLCVTVQRRFEHLRRCSVFRKSTIWRLHFGKGKTQIIWQTVLQFWNRLSVTGYRLTSLLQIYLGATAFWQCDNYNLKSNRQCNNIVSYEFIWICRTCDYIIVECSLLCAV